MSVRDLELHRRMLEQKLARARRGKGNSVTTIIRTPSPTLNLQYLLACQGLNPGPLDGVAGPRTAAALEAIQRAHGLPLQPDVDPALDHDLGAALTAGLSSGERAVLEGLKHLGYTESPPGSNMTKFGQWFGHNGIPWCNLLVSYCFLEGAGVELCAGYHAPGIRPGKGSAYVPSTMAWLKSRNLVVPQPRAGDIVIYGWDGHTPEHIGMAAGELDAGGAFPSLEGNTSLGNDSDGGEVLLRPRTMRTVLALGRIP